MKAFDFQDVPMQTYEGMEGVTIRWVIGENVEAPNYYMRIIDVQVGHATGYHQHPWEHETYVLEGEGAVRQGEERTPIAPGTCVYVAPDEIHQFINTGEAVLRIICVIPKPQQ